jgi:predicted nucleotidyltransferase
MSPAPSRAHGSRSPRGRNPPANPAEIADALRVARQVADEIDPRRRKTIVLVGSWARGDAHSESDIDLWVIGRRVGDVMFERDSRQVSVRYATAAGDRRAMRSPPRLGGAIPGWRSARVLRDPKGVAAKLRSEARRFRWRSVRQDCRTYIADQLVGWAQHVAKLLRALETGESETASVQRGLIANRMALLRSLEFEYLWGTENGLWERVASRAGPAFLEAQKAALGTRGAGWRASCEGALRLYSITAQANLGLLRGENRRIVERICRQAGYPVAPTPPASRRRDIMEPELPPRAETRRRVVG